METTSIAKESNHPIQADEERMKDSLIRHHSLTSIATKKMDIWKMVDEYQKRFSVPKALILKWLNIKNQKSQFGASQGNSNPTKSLDNSYVTDDGSVSSDSSNSNSFMSERNVSKLLIKESVVELEESSNDKDDR